MTLKKLAEEYDAYQTIDGSGFRRRARVLQSIWREEQGYPCGIHNGNPLGSRLQMPWAKSMLANYLTDTIQAVVKAEVCEATEGEGKLFGYPRIYNDLLSSQPLCFNLFGELTQDFALASKVIKTLTAGRFTEVTKIEFEYSPGRRDPRYLNDRSAFDVFLRCKTSTGKEGFIGIEVKYHENLAGKAGDDKKEYSKVARQMKCFREDLEPLKQSPLQQIWRDHLLAGITRIEDQYADGFFVTLYPKDNTHVSKALKAYRQQLSREDSFASWTLEDFVTTLRSHSAAPWITAFTDRYLAFEKIDKLLESDS
jgi:hypothetical protein